MKDLRGDAHLCLEWQHYLITQLGGISKKKHHTLSCEKPTSVLAAPADCSLEIVFLWKWQFQKDKNLSKTTNMKRMANLILLLPVMNYSLGSSPRAWGTLSNAFRPHYRWLPAICAENSRVCLFYSCPNGGNHALTSLHKVSWPLNPRTALCLHYQK